LHPHALLVNIHNRSGRATCAGQDSSSSSCCCSDLVVHSSTGQGQHQASVLPRSHLAAVQRQKQQWRIAPHSHLDLNQPVVLVAIPKPGLGHQSQSPITVNRVSRQQEGGKGGRRLSAAAAVPTSISGSLRSSPVQSAAATTEQTPNHWLPKLTDKGAAVTNTPSTASTSSNISSSNNSSSITRDDVANAALLLRSKAEAHVASLPALHIRQDRFDAVDAAVREVAEAQPVLGPLLRLVAELYRHAADHQTPALGFPPAADHRRTAAAAASPSLKAAGAEASSLAAAAERAQVHGDDDVRSVSSSGSSFTTAASGSGGREFETAAVTTRQHSLAARGHQRAVHWLDDHSVGDADGLSQGQVPTANGTTAPPAAPPAAPSHSHRINLVSDRYRGSSFGPQHPCQRHVPATDEATAAGASTSCAPAREAEPHGGADAGSPRGSLSSDTGESGNGATPSSGRGPSAGPGQEGKQAPFERYSWGTALTSDPWIAAPPGVARLDLSDLAGRIHEQRQRRFAAFREHQARLAAGGGAAAAVAAPPRQL